MVKNLPAMQETWVQSLGREDPLEKRMETHSSILAWSISWTEKPDRLQSMGLQRVRHELWSLGAATPEPGIYMKNSVQLEAVFMLLAQRLEGKGRSCHSGSITDCQEGSQEEGK